MRFISELENEQYENSFRIEKSFDLELIREKEFIDFLSLGGYEIVDITKSAGKQNLVKKQIWVTRNGKSFKQTVWVSAVTNEQKDTPIGEEISPTVKGLNMTKYSDKSILISGDTYTNVDLMRKIKQETGFGLWNGKLKGWIFSLTQIDKVLGLIWSDVVQKDEDKAQAIQNQKNESLTEGDEVYVGGETWEVIGSASDSEGIKYNMKLPDGTKLEGVNEKVIDVQPIKDDKKIGEVINNAQPENRAKTEKQLFGIKPIDNIHSYSLQEYMAMHGISEADIQKAINRIKGVGNGDKKKSSSGSSSGGNKSAKDQTEGLTKNQLIGKLISKHYNAVKEAIDRGDEVPESALELYSELKTLYSQKRQAMSEETKRKISEALKKNKPDEVSEKKVNDLSEETIEGVEEFFKETNLSKEAQEEQGKLADLIAERETLIQKSTEIRKQARDIKEKDRSEYYRLSEEASSLYTKAERMDSEIRKQKNIVQVLSNGGGFSKIDDKKGVSHSKVPDFSNVNTENIKFDVKSILTKDKPPYVPEIDMEAFKDSGYILEAVRVGEDKYMLATNGYSEYHKDYSKGFTSITKGYSPEERGYVTLSLDQLVLTQDYYTTKQKALFNKTAGERNQRQINTWNSLPESRKLSYYNQKNFYNGMPAKVKNKITEAEWNKLSLGEKEEIYIPVKKYGAERLKPKFDEFTMPGSLHEMYERFINPEAKSERGYGSAEVFLYWNAYINTLKYKINDINIQREESSGVREKALETSYGESGTNDALLKELGIKVKRQNGDEIKPLEIEQIRNAWGDVVKTFGGLKELALKDGLKVSHAGNTYMYASKAIGVYVPSYNAIGVTAKLGEDQLGYTLGHEVSHWMDKAIGSKTGRRHASDNYESTAGKIATRFRNNMNKSTDSNYLNATHECFARAFEQYHAIESHGQNAIRGGEKGQRYIDSPEYVSLETYNQLKPLIKQFLEENRDILKSMRIDIF